MNCENKLLDPERGTEVMLRQSGSQRGCFWKSLCAVAVLGLLAVSTYLLLCQLRVLPSTQVSDSGEAQSLIFIQLCLRNTRSALSRLRRQVGDDPRGRIGAHLTASPISRGENVMWQNKADPTFSEGVEFRDNSLVIETPGQYFVYTQVVFNSVGCQDQTIYLNHKLDKLSSSYPEKALLLSATKSACHYGKHQDPWFKTSYQGAVFEFEEGDQIFSGVNKEVVDYVDTAQGKSFFGIFAV
ncbi:tumor necrosis factor-like [Mustelus asterias]